MKMSTRGDKTRNQAKTTREAKAPGAGKPAEKPAASVQAETGLLDMNQAIDLLKTSRPTFFRWVRAGKIKGAKVGRQWRFTREEIDRFLKGHEPVVELMADIKPLLRALSERVSQCGLADTPLTADDVVLQAVMRMILLGVAMKASDLHIVPTLSRKDEKPTVEIRCRVDGVLQTVAEMDPRLLAPVIERWKRMANCNIRESRLPQDGRIRVNIRQQDLDLRVSFLPLCLGESLTARFLSRAVVILDLDRIAYAPPVKEQLAKALRAPWGMIVVTGPTGCGKTTALYACVNRLVSPGIKIVSVEEPVEYMLPGVAQIQIAQSIGLTFASALRAILRADPDVILIGEIRDSETLKIAHQCALTGHLVLTTLHTKDAAGALVRMVDIGSPAFLVSDTAKLVVAQRLVRRLCPQCSKPGVPAATMLERAEQIVRRSGLDWNALPKAFREPAGCAHCHQTGYRGRAVIAEALEMTPALARALIENATAEELTALAVKQGMVTLAADGILRAAKGETSVSEAISVSDV